MRLRPSDSAASPTTASARSSSPANPTGTSPPASLPAGIGGARSNRAAGGGGEEGCVDGAGVCAGESGGEVFVVDVEFPVEVDAIVVVVGGVVFGAGVADESEYLGSTRLMGQGGVRGGGCGGGRRG